MSAKNVIFFVFLHEVPTTLQSVVHEGILLSGPVFLPFLSGLRGGGLVKLFILNLGF